MDCLFCKIAKKEASATVYYEDDQVIAFKCIPPLAPVHILIIPKKHIKSIDDLTEADKKLAGHIILTAQKIARDLKISKEGYKLLFRVGKHGGQEVEHIHLHLIGGAKLYEEIRPI